MPLPSFILFISLPRTWVILILLHGITFNRKRPCHTSAFPVTSQFSLIGSLREKKKKQKRRSQNLLPHHLPKNTKYYILIHITYPANTHTHIINKKETELSSLSRSFNWPIHTICLYLCVCT